MARARDPMAGSAGSVAAPPRWPAAQQAQKARPAAAAVLMDTPTAAWPGGGAVAGATGKVFFTMDGQDYVCSAPWWRAPTRTW